MKKGNSFKCTICEEVFVRDDIQIFKPEIYCLGCFEALDDELGFACPCGGDFHIKDQLEDLSILFKCEKCDSEKIMGRQEL